MGILRPVVREEAATVTKVMATRCKGLGHVEHAYTTHQTKRNAWQSAQATNSKECSGNWGPHGLLAPIAAYDLYDNFSPLHIAVQFLSTNLLELFLSLQASFLRIQTRGVFTPLFLYRKKIERFRPT